ncbi:MAG: hypothetical protein R3D31_06110 [Hyphomicrobiaceae bacterium]
MRMIRTCAGLVVALGFGVSLATPVQANSVCDWYVKEALRQQQSNVQKRCNYRGGEWSADPAYHMRWCQGVAPNAARALKAKRDADLQRCR